MSEVTLLNCDCMEYMKGCEDNSFDLAIVDPPYGVDRFTKNTVVSRALKYGQIETVDRLVPNDAYFTELFRVSENQIIWGGNYFPLPPTRGFVFWYKHQPVHTYADGEYAWTSFQRNAQCFDFQYYGNLQGCTKADKKIHPTQKPLELYGWLLKNYAEKGQRILDTHLGSGSSAIAAHYFGCDFVGMEIDEDYYKAAVERFNNETKQETLF